MTAKTDVVATCHRTSGGASQSAERLRFQLQAHLETTRQIKGNLSRACQMQTGVGHARAK